jgi:diketogulonate reductase-like aldo/keto reductase
MAHPPFLYGTAWKENDSERLTRLAIENGFRGIDTANQRKHYFEEGVGAGIAASGVPRSELFLQTKFTYRDSQDHRLPFDPKADVGTQVRQSYASSLEHLRTDFIDSYVLHGPSRRRGLSPDDQEAWRAMEELNARHLGISNVALDQLEELWTFARIKPSFVQNRCYAATGWDANVREFCKRHGIVYQGFSLLTANIGELRTAKFREIVQRTGRTPAQLVFRFAIEVGMLPLTGTTDAAHMREDLEALTFTLEAEDVARIETLHQR